MPHLRIEYSRGLADKIAIDDLYVSGAFAPDASYVDGAQLSGSVDTRPLAILVGDDEGEGAVCELAASIGVQCETCPSDGEPFCLSLVARSITATKESFTLEVIADPCERAECADTEACQ